MSERPAILCATDLTQASERPREMAIALARVFDAPIDLVFAYADELPNVETESDDLSAAIEAAKESIRKHCEVLAAILDKEATMIRDAGVQCECYFVAGVPWRVVADHAAKSQSPMIVIGAHGGKGAVRVEKNGLAEAVLGTTVDRVLRATDRPVCVMTGESAIKSDLTGTRWIVGYDFSTESNAALDFAKNLSESVHGELHVANVVPPAGDEGAPDSERTWRQLLREHSKKEADEKLKKRGERTRAKRDGASGCVRVFPAQALAIHSRWPALAADGLVLGAHGHRCSVDSWWGKHRRRDLAACVGSRVFDLRLVRLHGFEPHRAQRER
ncbi:MAG: universal stress protein [Polyangiales bacterium]